MSDKKDAIVKTTIRLFAKEGINVPTARLAKEAGVSNGTLFNHFETKQGLIDHIYVRIKSSIAKPILSAVSLEGDLRDVILAVWLGYWEWARNNPLELTVLELLKTSQTLSEDVLEEGGQAWQGVYDIVEDAVAKGVFVDVSVEMVCMISEGMLRSCLTYAKMHNLSDQEATAQVEKSFDIFWKGITQ